MKKRNGRKRLSESWKKWILLSFLGATVAALLSFTSPIRRINQTVSDALFQRTQGGDSRIVVIGIDGDALDEIGAWPWSRHVMADVINELNADPASRPAAIGLDVVFANYTSAQADMALADAAAAGNVAVACTAEYSSELVRLDDGGVYMDDFSVNSVAEPYRDLARNALVGHTNAMYDTDGVLRHHLWKVNAADGSEIYSLPYQLYTLYCQYWQEDYRFTPHTDSRGFWWVHFEGAPGDYYRYSVMDILSGEYDRDMLAGAVVLIGPYDPGLADDYVTAADHAHRMYGVEYLANVVNAMLLREDKRENSIAEQAVSLFLLCFFVGILFYMLDMGSALMRYGVIMAGSLFIIWSAYQLGTVLHPFSLPMGLSIQFAGSVADHYYMVAKARKFVENTFQRYVDPGILKELLHEDTDSLALGGKNKNIAVLFVDIRGFTTLSEGLDPETVVSILNEYLTLTSSCVKRYGGTLDKFIGDCTMAFWGAPLPCEDPVWRACCAAMDMAQGGAILEQRLEKQFHRHVSFGIGVHYGPAVVGNIGSTERMDYTAIGDTVNTASRLESNAPAGTIYISRVVAEMLGERAQTTSVGTTIKLKGKTEGFEILTLDSLKGSGKEREETAR